VNVWLIGATVLACGLLPCLYVCLRAPILDAIVALETASAVAALVLLLLAEGFHRSSYFTLPIVLAALGFVGALVFVRFLGERSQ
jgi:multisubunit Na+/H+ antiporter MnhF subunit